MTVPASAGIIQMATSGLVMGFAAQRHQRNMVTIEWQEVVIKSEGSTKGVWQVKGFGYWLTSRQIL